MTQGQFKSDPLQCMPKDLTPTEAVKDWPEMSTASAKAFKAFTGIKSNKYSRLVRKGNHIFQVDESPQARCVYNHTRQF